VVQAKALDQTPVQNLGLDLDTAKALTLVPDTVMDLTPALIQAAVQDLDQDQAASAEALVVFSAVVPVDQEDSAAD
jgi:hypothetical protein